MFARIQGYLRGVGQRPMIPLLDALPEMECEAAVSSTVMYSCSEGAASISGSVPQVSELQDKLKHNAT